MFNILKYILGFFLLVTVFTMCNSIKKSLDNKDLSYLNKTIDSMYNLDQKIRYSSIELDSIYGVDFKSNGKFLFHNEKKLKLGEKFVSYENKQDSIVKVRDKIDLSNTKKLIQLTKRYGFPSKNRLKAKKACSYLIFVHSPREYREEIKQLISEEYKMQRISEYEKAYIDWHLQGRNGAPPRLGKNNRVIYNTN